LLKRFKANFPASSAETPTVSQPCALNLDPTICLMQLPNSFPAIMTWRGYLVTIRTLFAELDATIPISGGCFKMFALSASMVNNHPTKTFCGI
jgi:hypothetical protein